jgi:hypothetical protein
MQPEITEVFSLILSVGRSLATSLKYFSYFSLTKLSAAIIFL